METSDPLECLNHCYHPLINPIQKIALYESKSHFYLIGSTNDESKFQVLQINRLLPKTLQIDNDDRYYNHNEITQLVSRIEKNNKQPSGSKRVSAFGVFGFIKFLEGFYIILITKRQKVATIGLHTVYKIGNTLMKYIPHESVRVQHPLEHRYLKMFQNMDLSSNFYFSYSYDITNTLQHNMNILSTNIGNNDGKVFAFRSPPNRKFVWNNYLLSEVEDQINNNWILHVIHGFIGQSAINILGRSIHVSLIGRRSNQFAGTRFLKRGANLAGFVANFVETEQIVYDTTVSSLMLGRFTSFVQIRGSVPCHWSQDIAKIVAKPPITLDLSDPFAESAAKHFNRVLKDHGAPIIILNLVKKRERKKHESILSEELSQAVQYLNQFLPPKFAIEYHNFDMARMNKGKQANVLDKLAQIAKDAITKTGFYQSKPNYYNQKSNTILGRVNRKGAQFGFEQTGVIRTNCVDCLDRTNTAQFALGKCALAYQLCSLGVLHITTLAFDTDCVRMLESLYEDHGDTLALQYGGSQLVHRIQTYRKTAPWASQGNDIMQTLSRYYSNTFSDNEKQNTINLFLGVFIPERQKEHIWDLTTDYYLHNDSKMRLYRDSLCKWWDDDILPNLPYATYSCDVVEKIPVTSGDIQVDLYTEYYRLHKVTTLSDSLFFVINNNFIDFVPKNALNLSPFIVRIRPGRKYEDSINTRSQKDKKNRYSTLVSGQSQSNSTTPSTSSNDESESSKKNDNTYHIDEQSVVFDTLECELITVVGKKTYEFRIQNVNSRSISIYKRYNLSVIKPVSCDLYHSNPETYFVNENSIDYYKKQLQFMKITVR